MGKLKKIITSLHTSTKRNYLSRMNDNKVKCMKKANKFDYNYWDGNRKYGYGGYKYIPGRWSKVAKKIIRKVIMEEGFLQILFSKNITSGTSIPDIQKYYHKVI